MKNHLAPVPGSFQKDESGIVAAQAIAVVVAAVTIGIGALVFYQVVGNLPVIAGNRGDGTVAGSDTAQQNATSTAYNTTITNVRTNTNTGFTLLTIGLLVAAAVAILLIVQALGGFGGQRGR